MSDIDQHAIDQHDSGFEDVKVPLEAEDGALCAEVEVGREGVEAVHLEVFDRSVDSAREDEPGAEVERDERLVHLGVVDAALAAA